MLLSKNNNFRVIYYLFVLQLFVSNTVNSSTIHVPENCSSIQEAIDSAINTTIILIAPGKYIENINIQNKDIVLASQSKDPFETIIDGNLKDSVVSISNDLQYTVTISGISVTNGNSRGPGGGGIYCSKGKVIIDNVIISKNYASSGGGVYIDGDSELTISNSIINNNFAYCDGGGAYFSTDLIRMNNVMISYNQASLEHNYGRGGGVCFWNCKDGNFENCIVSYNIGIMGGGIFTHFSDITLVNFTIADNMISSENASGGGGLHIIMNSNLIIINSIIWNNIRSEIALHGYYSSQKNTLNISSSNVQKGKNGIEYEDNDIVKWDDNNINAFPFFADCTKNDYYLLALSPCIDSGVIYDSNIKFIGMAPDMGAYEYASAIIGDSNNDGILTLIDLILLIKLSTGENVEGLNYLYSDINGDNSLDTRDIIALIKKISL